ncbi:MAG: LacI family DNA-binding transcriptional regulator [Candidatus Promineofilum sp.]|nr:LacI family DNA-binding transcriptional regulator [Promineifilum sp.]
MADEPRSNRRPSMSDVAKLAGVSQTTVSFILNDTPGNSIPPETRERVLAAIRELDYRPNVSARNLRTQSTNLIGYGFDDPGGVASHPVLDQFLYSAILSLEEAGYHLLTFVAGQRTDTAVYEELYRRGQVSGYLVANTNDNDPRIACLLDNGVPFASFGRANDEWQFAWADVDGRSGMAQVVAHLVARGHRRIGLITWPQGSKAGSHREEGYADGLRAAGIAPDPAWLFRGENLVQTGAAGLSHLLTLPEEQRPTAVACVSDLIAVGVLNAAAAAGLAVGHDLAVTGYDDSALAQFLHPPLTSVRQPIAAIGRHLVEALLAQVRHDPIPAQGVMLEPELIIRASSGQLGIRN